MARIGNFQLPVETTLIDSRTEFVLGRVRRIVRITSVLNRYSTRAAFQSANEALEAEIERFDRGETDLSINPGRFLLGRRRKYEATRDDERCLAAFTLEVLGDNRFERSETLHSFTAAITGSPTVLNLPTGGNWPSLPRIVFSTAVNCSNPAFATSGGSLTVQQIFSGGAILELDSEERTALSGTTNLLSSVTGDFVELPPGGATLTCSDGSPTHSGSIQVFWRDRWV
jgi:hypothetical protein